MNKIKIDCKMIKDKEGLHEKLKHCFDFPNYYGKNLDALWDELTMINESTEVQLLHFETLVKRLGSYGESVIKTFDEAQNENENIKIEFK